MIGLKLDDNASKRTYYITQDLGAENLNVDVCQKGNYSVDYYFTIPAENLIQFIVEYQKQQGII